MSNKSLPEWVSNLIGVSEQLKNSPNLPLPKDYWEKEGIILKQMREKHEQEKNMLKMSHKRMQDVFDI